MTMKKKILDALEGAAIAAFEGEETESELKELRYELALLDEKDLKAVERSRVTPKAWASFFVKGLSAARQLAEVIKLVRGLK